MSTNEKTVTPATQEPAKCSNYEVNCLHIINIEKEYGALISDTAMTTCKWIVYAVLCQAIDVFGTVTNIINIICFIKQGFKDPINVSLLGLAISDLGCLIPLIWTNICLTPAFSEIDLPFDPEEAQYLLGTWSHITFTRLSSWITALITLERCVCVTLPLQVKDIITTKRVSVLTICVFTALLLSEAPMYVIGRLDLKYFPERNKTLVGLVFTDNRDHIEKISFAINNIFVSFSAFMVIIVCTAILVVHLKNTTTWRKMSTSQGQTDSVSSRNRKVSKMVVMISCLFIASFLPVGIIFIATRCETEISFDGKYKHMAFLLCGLGFILESINASMNIFIYYNMSSKYRSTLHQLFCIDK